MIGVRSTTRIVFATLSAFLLLVSISSLAHGDSIDYVASEISPSANFEGQSGNFSLIDPVVGGAVISFNLTFEIDTKGSTTSYPRTVKWARTDEVTKPDGAPDPLVTFGPNADPFFQGTFVNISTQLTTSVAGRTIDFTVNGDWVGSAVTDGTGLAVLSHDPSSLAVGDHTVVASFQGEACGYNASGRSATLGVIYDFLGFQPPVKIDGVGAGLFSGRVIPVKMVIADAFGNAVPDAGAFVFFSQTSANVT